MVITIALLILCGIAFYIYKKRKYKKEWEFTYQYFTELVKQEELSIEDKVKSAIEDSKIARSKTNIK